VSFDQAPPNLILFETMLIPCETAGTLFPLFYHSTVQARPTTELGERLRQLILPRPSLPIRGRRVHWQFDPEEIACYYPYFIEHLQTMVRHLPYASTPFNRLMVDEDIREQDNAL